MNLTMKQKSDLVRAAERRLALESTTRMGDRAVFAVAVIVFIVWGML